MSSTPNYPALKLLQLADQSLLAGSLAEAESRYRRVLTHDPTNAAALHQLGLLAWQQGRKAEARSLLEQALAAEPTHLQLLMSYGQMLHELSEPRLALDAFLRVLAIDNTLPDIWNAAGVCFQETDQPASAIEFYLRALNLQPEFPEALNNLGVVLTHENDPASAIHHFHQALALKPDYADCHSNLGVAHRARLDYNAAIASFAEAYRFNPHSSDIANSYGEALSLTYDPRATALLRQAVDLRPSDPEKHFNLALDLLKRGQYAEGWQQYEWRWQRAKKQTPLRPMTQPFWRNQAGQSLEGKTILLHAEQGYGDAIQFLRYLPLVLALGPHVLLEVSDPLVRLTLELARQFPNRVDVIRYGDPLPTFDFHVPLMSLPAAFATTAETIPPPLRFTLPATIAPANDSLRIGLVWSGNPIHDRDRERSIPIDALKPLFAAFPHATWISLQPPAATAQLHTAGIPIEQAPLTDFLDTANLLDTLDAVLTVDTATAHLAATQGVPTYILLPYVADWRWLAPPTQIPSTTLNPWYPHAHIFRQTHQPSAEPQTSLWQPVIAEVITALKALRHVSFETATS
jgi:tetratricopeptide (TPR) repeat protein